MTGFGLGRAVFVTYSKGLRPDFIFSCFTRTGPDSNYS